MNNRISERRINATAALLYLKNPNNHQKDLELWEGNETFQLPSKYLVRKEIKQQTKQPDSTSGTVINTTVANTENEDDLPLSMTNTSQTNQEELEETLRVSKRHEFR